MAKVTKKMLEKGVLTESKESKHKTTANNDISHCALGDNSFEEIRYILSLIELERDF